MIIMPAKGILPKANRSCNAGGPVKAALEASARSDYARLITGDTMHIDGGYHLIG